MTASVKAAIESGVPPPERAEKLCVQLNTLIEGYSKLTLDLADVNDPLHAGMVGATVSVLRSMAATMDIVAASLNNRPLKDGLHGIRQSSGEQTKQERQMSLLRQKG